MHLSMLSRGEVRIRAGMGILIRHSEGVAFDFMDSPQGADI